MTDSFEDKKVLGLAVGVPFGTKFQSWYLNGQEAIDILPFLQGKELIAHNIGFDLEIAEQNGLVHEGPLWDTMIMAHLCNENRMSYELDMLSMVLLGQRKQPMNQISKIFDGWNNIPPEIMGPYALQDINLTYQLFTKLYADLQHQGLLDLWEDAEQYIRTLRQVRRAGLDIDWDLLQSMRQEAAIRIQEIKTELGFDPAKSSELIKRLFHDLKLAPTSIKEKSGKPATDDAALRELTRKYPEHSSTLALIQEYRNRAKALSTWYDGFLKRRGSTERLYPGLKQHGTKTGRLSCAEPNLQQLPRDGGRVKRIFVDRPGYRLIEFDYSQIELRVGGYYAEGVGDPRMADTYRLGADVHSLTSSLVGAYEVLEDPKEARQVGKTGNFLWIYGGSAARFQSMMFNQYNISITLDQATTWTEAFHANYPGFREVGRRCQRMVMQRAATTGKGTGYVTTWNGRRRRYTKASWMDDKQWWRETSSAFNAVVQGGCAAVLMKTMNNIARAELPSIMCNTVHDSIWFYVPEDQLEEQIEIIIKMMREVPEAKFNLPFEVDYKLWTEHGG